MVLDEDFEHKVNRDIDEILNERRPSDSFTKMMFKWNWEFENASDFAYGMNVGLCFGVVMGRFVGTYSDSSLTEETIREVVDIMSLRMEDIKKRFKPKK